MKHVKTYESFLSESNKEQEVVYMAPSGRASLQKYDEKIAKVVSDEGNSITIEFEDGKKLSEVPKSQVRYLAPKK
jgi:hypothetical protein